MKKLASLVLIISIILTYSISAFAAPKGIKIYSNNNSTIPAEISSMLRNPDTPQSSNQFLLTITRPDEDTESTYKKSYVISGDTWDTGYKDVRVVLGKYNPSTGKYELMQNADGESSWDVGSYGAFAKEIILTKGSNKIRILAYRTSDADKGYSSKNVQVCDFTVKLLDSSILSKVVNTVVDISDLIFQK